MAAKQSKIEEKQENMVETNQKWQKTDKNDRKPWKMWSFKNYLLPSSHFCPAKLFCQAILKNSPANGQKLEDKLLKNRQKWMKNKFALL